MLETIIIEQYWTILGILALSMVVMASVFGDSVFYPKKNKKRAIISLIGFLCCLASIIGLLVLGVGNYIQYLDEIVVEISEATCLELITLHSEYPEQIREFIKKRTQAKIITDCVPQLETPIQTESRR